nr:lipase 3-like [Halyomorpha halys]
MIPGLPNVNELAALGGYDSTNYEVITEDGYSLWLFRIGNNSGPPVLLQHGVMVAADSWITRTDPKKSLVFMMLKRGFDVWLSNERGTVFNEYSLDYPKTDPRFWNFSFDQSGYYDTPAFVDTVLEVRNATKLFYIGHSLGTVTFLIMASSRPEYNNKIKAAVLLSPVAIPPAREEQRTPLRLIVDNFGLINRVLKQFGQLELAPRTEATINAIKELCDKYENTQTICLDLFGIFTGDDRKNLDRNDFDFFLLYSASGSSLKTYNHYFGQLAQTGEFKKYDYGPTENLRRYGNIKPPFYQLDLVTSPVALFWGYNDPFLSESSVNKLASQLPNVILNKAVPDPKFAHNDMIIGDNAYIVLYPDVIHVLESYSDYDVKDVPHEK